MFMSLPPKWKGCMFMSLPPKCTSMISRAAWLSLFSLLIFNRDMRSSGKKSHGNKSTFFKRVLRMVRVECSIASNSHVISPGSKTQFSQFVVVCLRVCEKKIMLSSFIGFSSSSRYSFIHSNAKYGLCRTVQKAFHPAGVTLGFPSRCSSFSRLL